MARGFRVSDLVSVKSWPAAHATRMAVPSLSALRYRRLPGTSSIDFESLEGASVQQLRGWCSTEAGPRRRRGGTTCKLHEEWELRPQGFALAKDRHFEDVSSEIESQGVLQMKATARIGLVPGSPSPHPYGLGPACRAAKGSPKQTWYRQSLPETGNRPMLSQRTALFPGRIGM